MQPNTTWWLAGGLAVLAVGLVLTKAARYSAPPPPRVLLIAEGEPQDIPMQSYLHYDFELDGQCAITGRIVGVAGGNKDFQAFLVDDADYRNWLVSGEARAFWQTGQVTAASIDARVSGPGTFHLIVNNGFSRLTPKTVTVDAQAECR